MPVPEISWRLHPTYWGRGLATEAAGPCSSMGSTTLGFDQIVSIYEPENVASERIMERIGMAVDRDTLHPEKGVPLRVYRLTSNAWRRDHAGD